MYICVAPGQGAVGEIDGSFAGIYNRSIPDSMGSLVESNCSYILKSSLLLVCVVWFNRELRVYVTFSIHVEVCLCVVYVFMPLEGTTPAIGVQENCMLLLLLLHALYLSSCSHIAFYASLSTASSFSVV